MSLEYAITLIHKGFGGEHAHKRFVLNDEDDIVIRRGPLRVLHYTYLSAPLDGFFPQRVGLMLRTAR
uniref:Uncharacterized protein n=1 Tax=Sphingomonas sp. NS2 TaxID=908605 RepID=A0A0D4ZYD2_9SPHN|nr:hypothetical protein plasmid201_084 [Sphingomonas sp. NS2]